MGIKHATQITGTNNPSKQVSKDAWNEELAGWKPDTISSFTSDTGASLSTVTDSSTTKTIATTANSNAAADNVFPLVARIQSGSGTLPKIELNGDGLWYPERIARTGDVVKLRVTTPGTGNTETVIRLYYPGGYVDWSLTTVNIDSDAGAFLTATGITDPTISGAVNDLVVALKAASIWTKLDALYPFVGGTATKHKFNLIDPDDDDASYRLTFHGTWTHDANGIQGDGASAYAQTHYVQSSTTSQAIGAYSLSSAAHGGGGNPLLDDYAIAASNSGFSNMSACSPRTQGNKVCFFYGTNSYSPGATTSDGSGLVITNRLGGTATECYQNGSLIHTQSDTVTLCSQEYYIGALNKGGTPDNYTDRPLAMVLIGDGLDATEHGDLYSAIQAFQTALSRNV